MIDIIDKGYKDVTDEWLKNVNLKNSKIIFDDYFIDDNGIIHPIFGIEHMEIASKNSDEYKMAKILLKQLGGEIHLVPTITTINNTNNSTRTPDFKINGVKWDLKTPIYKENYFNLINDLLKKPNLRLQSERFIIDLKNYKGIHKEEIQIMCTRMFKNRYRWWVKSLIIIQNNTIYKIYIRK